MESGKEQEVSNKPKTELQTEDVPSEHNTAEGHEGQEENGGPRLVGEQSQVFQSRMYPSLETRHSQEWNTGSEVPPNVHDAVGYTNEIRDDEKPVDVDTIIPTGNDIQLEVFKCLPEFNGTVGTYRNWKNQAMRAMKPIETFVGHPKYGAALGIIRAKIVGAASNTLINSATPYNFKAFITALDRAYMDLRPMYTIEGELTKLIQGTKTLKEFYNDINQALNVLITKIMQTYDTKSAIEALRTEAQRKAVRTFIIGVRSGYIRQILYGRTPETLDGALAIAQTVYYDSDHLRLDRTGQYGQAYERNWTANLNPRQQNHGLRFSSPQNQTGNQYRPIKRTPREYNINENTRYSGNQQPTRAQQGGDRGYYQQRPGNKDRMTGDNQPHQPSDGRQQQIHQIITEEDAGAENIASAFLDE